MIVIDASIANKLVLPLEENHNKVKEIFRKHAQAVEEIIVPDLVLYEIANTLATKSAIALNEITESLTIIYKANLHIYHCQEPEVKEAAKLAKKHGTSVYDMLYVVVAKKHNTTLITADKQFIKQTGFKFVKLL